MLLPYFVYIALQNSLVEALCLWKNFWTWRSEKRKKVLRKKKEGNKKQAQRRKKGYHSVKKRKTSPCESDWSSKLASRFRTKKSLSNQNFSYMMLKTRFPFFFMQVPASIQKRYQSPRIVILKAVCRFVVLFLSTFSGFSILTAGFSFAFDNFAHYCVVP